MNETKQTLVSEFERLRDLIRAMGPIRDGAGTADPDPRIVAAEEMAKALEAARAFIYGDMGDYGVRPDYEDDKALNIIDSALAAWNALK